MREADDPRDFSAGQALTVPMGADERATQQAFDAVAADYAALLPDLSVEAPLDRAVLGAFVEMVRQAGDGVVADVGCGTGRVAAHLAEQGLRVVGFDVSPRMVALARGAHRDVAVAHVRELPVRSGALGGVLAWYSLINLGVERLVDAVHELARVTRPGAPVLLAFQSGEGERVDRTTAYGRAVPMTYVRHRVEVVEQALTEAQLAVHATVRRRAALAHETTPQAFVLAVRT